MKRATSMLFNVLAEESDAAKAEESLQQATRKVKGNKLDAKTTGKTSDDSKQHPGTATKGDAGDGAVDSAAKAENGTANGAAHAQHDPSTEAAAVWQFGNEGGHLHELTAAEAAAAAALEVDRVNLAAELQQFTPEVILAELLGPLFVHPSQLTMEGLLGEGAFATVHKASMMPAAGGPALMVAVKRLKPEVLSGTGDLKDFLMEVNIMRKLRHPHIVRILGIGAADLSTLEAARRSIYVVQEVCEGGNLKALLVRHMTSRTPMFEKRDALRWSLHIASAMHYLHHVCRPMIIHRDMKLENILLSGDFRTAKLADFGLHKRARVNAATGQLTTPAPTTLTLSAIPTLPHDLSMLAVRTPSISPLPGNTGTHPAVLLGQGQDKTVNGKQQGLTAGLPQGYPGGWSTMAALDNDRSYYGGNAYFTSLGMAGGGSVHYKGSNAGSANATAHAGSSALAALKANNSTGGSGGGSTHTPVAAGGTGAVPGDAGAAAKAGPGSGSGRGSGKGLAAGQGLPPAPQPLLPGTGRGASLTGGTPHSNPSPSGSRPGVPHHANLPGSTSQTGSQGGASQHGPGQHQQQQPSLATLVHAASAVASRGATNTNKALLKVYSAASLQSMEASAHGGTAFVPSGGPSRHGPSNHGGGSALAALLTSAAGGQGPSQSAPEAAAVYEHWSVGPAAAATNSNNAGGGEGSAAPLSPMHLSRAPSSPLQPAGAPAAGLPTGVATLLMDPNQRGTLQALQAFLNTDQHPEGEAPGAGGDSTTHTVATVRASGSVHGFMRKRSGGLMGSQRGQPAAGSVGGSMHGGSMRGGNAAGQYLGRGSGGAGGAGTAGEGAPVGRDSIASSDAGTAAVAATKPQHQDSDTTVHRKMLALMALDAHMQAEVQSAVADGIACLRDRCFWEPRSAGSASQHNTGTAPAVHGSGGGAASAGSASAGGASTGGAGNSATAETVNAGSGSYHLGQGGSNPQQGSTWGAPLMRTIHEEARMSLDIPRNSGAHAVATSPGTKGEAHGSHGSSMVTGSSAAVTLDPSTTGTSASSHAAASRASPSPDVTVAISALQQSSTTAPAGTTDPPKPASPGDVKCLVNQDSTKASPAAGDAAADGASPTAPPAAAVLSGKGSGLRGMSSKGKTPTMGVMPSFYGVTSGGTVPSYSSVPSMLPAEGVPKMNAQFVDATQQVGSLMYMSPELVTGHVYNEKVDVFSFSIIMYELFTGRLLAFRGEFLNADESAVENYVMARAHGVRERLPTKWPTPLSSLISDCWAQDPAARPDFGTIVKRLQEMETSGTFAPNAPGANGSKGADGGCCTVM